MMPFSMHCVDLPQQAERNVEHKNLIKKYASGQPLGMFRSQEEAFLLCYDSKCSTAGFRSLRE